MRREHFKGGRGGQSRLHEHSLRPDQWYCWVRAHWPGCSSLQSCPHDRIVLQQRLRSFPRLDLIPIQHATFQFGEPLTISTSVLQAAHHDQLRGVSYCPSLPLRDGWVHLLPVAMTSSPNLQGSCSTALIPSVESAAQDHFQGVYFPGLASGVLWTDTGVGFFCVSLRCHRPLAMLSALHFSPALRLPVGRRIPSIGRGSVS